jgi:hypothetical protein
LPLWHPGDAQGARQLEQSKPGNVGPRSQVERRLFRVITWQEQPARQLAAQAGYKLGQHFYKALWALAAAGVVEKGKHGWRLSDVQL